MAFEPKEVLPGVWHIQDVMGVCMTLLVGSESALLVDAGYGFEDVAGCVRLLTGLPFRVLLTHGHHDHAMGARWFDRVLILPEDLPVYETYTDDFWRKHVLAGARGNGLSVDESAYLSAPMARPEPLSAEPMDLGGLTVRVLPCPGHTPGSAVLYVPERSLLLTGDNWNPLTWLFFPEAMPVQTYRRNMLDIRDLPFRHVLCSHRHQLFNRELLDSFLTGLTDETLCLAPASEEGLRFSLQTACAHLPMDQMLVFDKGKFESNVKGA